MKLLFTLFFFCYSSFSISQVYTSSCVPTAQMVNIYRNDVAKATVTRLFQINSTYKDSIDIPISYKDSVANVLYAVYNIPYSSLRDTIRTVFGSSTYYNYGPTYPGYDSLHFYNNGFVVSGVGYNTSFSPKAVKMYVNDTTSWVLQWMQGNYTNTNNVSVNTLALQYGITASDFYSFSGKYSFTARTSKGVNTIALAKAFSTIIGIPQSANAYTFAGDGNNVLLDYQVDGIKITYNNRCGDCPAGCDWGRTWSFKVFFSNCNVQYLGAENQGGGSNPLNPALSVYTCFGSILPLTFSSITGYLQGGKPALNWKVLTQVNVKEYIIERSDDGAQFYAVDKTPANTASTAEYNWKDGQVLSGTAWYRIKAVDIDGKVKYSSIVKLANNKNGSITVYPNPVQNHQFTVQFATPISGKVQARLYDIGGKQVWTTTISVTPQTGSRSFMLPSNLPSGTYSIVLQNEAINYKQTLLISNK